MRFTALFHQIYALETLRLAYLSQAFLAAEFPLKKDKSPAVQD
jgi:hypothetical protein